MNEEQKMAYTEVDSFDDAAITLRRKELKHQFETFQVRHLTNYMYVQAMWLKTLDCKLAEKDSRIAELEKEPLREIGIQEICEWIVDTYPPDVFTGESGVGAKLVVEMRDKAAEILKFRKEAADAVREADK